MSDSFCEHCGTPGSGQFCANCGQPRGGAVAAVVAVAPAYDPMAAEVHDAVKRARMRHGVPALLSFFIPGLGQVIKGDVLKGIIVFLVSAFCWFLCIVSSGSSWDRCSG